MHAQGGKNANMIKSITSSGLGLRDIVLMLIANDAIASLYAQMLGLSKFYSQEPIYLF